MDITVKGRVQRTNYRDQVEEIARKLNVTGHVENLKPYDVKIVAEGEEESIKNFIEQINIQKFPVFVEDLKIKKGHATGEFEYFEIKRGDWKEELGERLDTAGKLLHASLDKQDQMLDKQDQMLDKQEETIEVLGAKIDNQAQKTEEGFSKMDQNFTTLRQDYGKLSDKMDDINKTLKKLTDAILKLAEKSG